MKYKVGDRVRIKSLDWYYDNRDRIDEVECGNTNFIPDMVKYCGGIVTISVVLPTLEVYHIKEDGGMFNWTDEMIEGLAKEEKNLSDESWRYKNIFDHSQYPQSFECPEGYIFKDENGNVINAQKIVLEKKQKEYPKTYEECCKELNIAVRDLDILDNMLDTTEIIYRKNLDRLLNSFRKLIICRDAYWKIAGEELELGKPWEPDYDSGVNKYGIICMNGVVQKSNPTTNWERHLNKVFDFPTPEMRDAFKENFKSEIESCKELL